MDYQNGYCHYLAREIVRQAGGSYLVALGARDTWTEPVDEVLIHVWAVLPNGVIVDSLGATTPEATEERADLWLDFELTCDDTNDPWAGIEDYDTLDEFAIHFTPEKDEALDVIALQNDAAELIRLNCTFEDARPQT